MIILQFLYSFFFLIGICSGSFDAARSLRLLSQERFLSACKQYQGTDVSATVDLEGFGLPHRTMMITSLVDFISSNPGVASVDKSRLWGNTVGKTSISIQNTGHATLVVPASVEVTDLPTRIESLSVAALTEVAMVPSALGVPTVTLHQNLHRVNDRANVTVYANYDDGTFADVTLDTRITSLSPFLNISEDANGPQVVVLEAAELDGSVIMAEHSTCPGRAVIGVGRVVVTPTDVLPTSVPTVGVSLPLNASVPSVMPTVSVFPTSIPTSYSVIPTSVPSMYTASGAPSMFPTGAPTRAFGFPTSEPSCSPTETPTCSPSSAQSSKAPTTSPSTAPTKVPSVQPTVAPTILVTSLTPSSLPTVHSQLIDQFKYLVHPEISVTSGNGFPVHSFPTLTGYSKWTMPIGMLSGQSQYDISISVAGRQVGGSSVAATRKQVQSVTAVLKMKTAYESSPVISAAFQLRDEAGSTQVKRNVDVFMRVSLETTNQVVVFSCMMYDTISGAATCSGELPRSWFQYHANASVVVFTSSGIQSLELKVGLVATPTYSSHAVGVLAELPAAPVYAGETFTTTLLANTNGSALIAWNVFLHFDPHIVHLVDVVTAGSYVPEKLVRGSDSVRIFTHGVTAGVNLGNVTGSGIQLANVRFRVLANCSSGTFENLFTLTVMDLAYANSTELLPVSSGHFRDSRTGGNYLSGQLTVARHSLAGILPYSPQHELVDTGSLSGEPVMSSVVTLGVFSDPNAPLVDMSSSAVCNNFGEAIGSPSENPLLVTNDCSVTVATGCTMGASSVLVPVSLQSNNTLDIFNATVPFRVWCASTVSVHLRDHTLNSIEV